MDSGSDLRPPCGRLGRGPAAGVCRHPGCLPSLRVRFPQPKETVAQGRAYFEAVLDHLVASPSLIPGSPPDPAAMAASLVRTPPRTCRDGQDRDMGSEMFAWKAEAYAVLAPAKPAGDVPRLGEGYATHFDRTVTDALHAPVPPGWSSGDFDGNDTGSRYRSPLSRRR